MKKSSKDSEVYCSTCQCQSLTKRKINM
jgi:hypothetical protein